MDEQRNEDSANFKSSALAVTMIVMLLVPIVYVTFIKKEEPKEAIVIQQRVEAAPLTTNSQLDDQQKVLEASPSEKEYVNLAVSYYNAKRYRECINVSQKVIDINPKNATAYNNICSAYNCLSNWDSAIIAGNVALAIQPDFQLAKNNVAWAYKMKLESK
jgi:tetratricopeptide (TPR) repeat protein